MDWTEHINTNPNFIQRKDGKPIHTEPKQIKRKYNNNKDEIYTSPDNKEKMPLWWYNLKYKDKYEERFKNVE